MESGENISGGKQYKKMEHVKVWEDNLRPEQRKLIHDYNKQQNIKFNKMHSMRKNIIGLTIGAAVLSIYGYTWRQMSKDRLCEEIDSELKENLQH